MPKDERSIIIRGLDHPITLQTPYDAALMLQDIADVLGPDAIKGAQVIETRLQPERDITRYVFGIISHFGR